MAALLLGELGGATAEPPMDAELTRLEGLLATAAAGDRQRVAGRLRALLAGLDGAAPADGGEQRTSEAIEAATTADEVLALIDLDLDLGDR